MKIQGLEVKGLDSTEISQKLEKYVADYFKGYKLGTGQSMFMEGYELEFCEINDWIPAEYHNHFTNDDKFTCMSGYIVIDYKDGKADERVISIVMDEHSEYIYLLCLQDADEKGEENIIIIGDFTCT